jgi:hypothetical protein
MNSTKTSQNMAALINQKIRSVTNLSVEEKKQPPVPVGWVDTPNFRGNMFNMVGNLKHICGEGVFGKGRGRELAAKKSLTSFLRRSTEMDLFKCVEGGEIITHPLLEDKMINKLIGLGTRAFEYYSKLPYEQMIVKDKWANDARVRIGDPLNKSIQLHARVLSRSGKRFSAETISVKDQVIYMLKSSRGMLSEGHVVAFLNSGLKCPECGIVGQIGWCDGVSHKSVDAFRDAVCMNCREKGVITLFEIKTRWDNAVIKDGNGTYAGSFVALNTLMTIGANVYLVIASRDTGDVHIGKITSAKMRTNHNWLYALQEGYTWGGPSSYVTCAKGLMHCPVKMPILVETMTDDYVERVVNAAISQIDELK